MVAPALLPNTNAAFVDANGRATQEFRDFLIRLTGESDTAELQAEIDALAAEVAALMGAGGSTFNMSGPASVVVAGSPASGLVQVTLVGDTESVIQPTWYYGAGGDGTRGYHRLYDAFTAGSGIALTDSGYTMLGEVSDPSLLPGTGSPGEAYFVEGPAGSAGIWAWDGTAFTQDTAADGRIGIASAATDSSVPYFIPDGENYTVPLYKQALWKLPITLGSGSSITVLGALEQVT